MPQNTLFTSQHWTMQCLGAIKQQAITWTKDDPDLYHHVASRGHNELNIVEPSDIIWYYKMLLSLASSMAGHKFGCKPNI